MGVRELYEQTLAERGYESDPAQLRALDALERCENEWVDYKARRGNALTKLIARPPIPRGVYLWGGVGRGKSFLMDCFFNAVPLRRKTRLHFHEFMREVHRELAELQGTADPLQHLGKEIARRFRLICLDEFHVADITDAMILIACWRRCSRTGRASSPPRTSRPTGSIRTACIATGSCRRSSC